MTGNDDMRHKRGSQAGNRDMQSYCTKLIFTCLAGVDSFSSLSVTRQVFFFTNSWEEFFVKFAILDNGF